jgi:hypothetical protein
MVRVKPPAAISVLLMLAACSSTGNSDYSQFYRALRQSVAASLGNGRIAKDQAAAIPYASMGYRVNGGSEQLVVLATDANGEQLWTSKAHIVIVTRDGRIARTVGLPHDKTGMAPRTGEQLPAVAAALNGNVTYTRLEDFPDIPAYGILLTCTLAKQRAETITILGHGIQTIRIDETCRASDRKWPFTDRFWVAPDASLVWRSLQHLDPTDTIIETEILRPPG